MNAKLEDLLHQRAVLIEVCKAVSAIVDRISLEETALARAVAQRRAATVIEVALSAAPAVRPLLRSVGARPYQLCKLVAKRPATTFRNADKQGKFRPQESSRSLTLVKAARRNAPLPNWEAWAAFKVLIPLDCYLRLILGMD